MQKGMQIIGARPRPAYGKGGYDWEAGARLAQEHPGEAVLVAENVRNSRIRSVRNYKHAPFRTDTGHIQVDMRNSHLDPTEKVRYGDVIFTWIED